MEFLLCCGASRRGSLAGFQIPVRLLVKCDYLETVTWDMWLKRQNGTRAASLKQLGSLESELMERVWDRGEFSVRDLHLEFAPRLAYTTLMTTLDRLYKKGLLTRRKVGKAFHYAAAFTEKEYQELLTQHLFGMVLTDAPNNNAVLSCFVNAVGEADKEMLDKLDQLVKAKRRALRRTE